MAQELAIKICGVKTPDILEHVIAQGADMAGFMHFEKSPRHVPLDAIAGLAAAARDRIETVIVLVNPDNALVAAAAQTGVDWLQLHGSEAPERVTAIKALSGKKIIKALPVGEAADIAVIPLYATVADRVILDARPPGGASRPGGLGTVFDWTLLETLDRSVPFMLSGGLTVDNVASAVAGVRPFGLDVSSGVERAKGEKDAGRISQFIARARAAAQSKDQAL